MELVFSQPQLAPLAKGMIIPSLPNSEAVFLAAGVLGATIMPHVIYLHSSLTQHLHGGSAKERYQATRWDVAIAMTIAGFVNLAMMATAAAAFHFNGHTGIADLDEAYLTLEPLLSHAAATIFGLSLVAAGLSSTVVGTLAGQVVMQGFIRFHIPLWFRRCWKPCARWIISFARVKHCTLGFPIIRLNWQARPLRFSTISARHALFTSRSTRCLSAVLKTACFRY